MKRLMILMAKRPQAGHTKTRLTPYLSANDAANLYHCFLQDKVATMRQVTGVQPVIAYAPDDAVSFFTELAPDFDLFPQVGADLSVRLANVFNIAFKLGYKQVAAIDSDTVTLPAAHLSAIFAALNDDGLDVTLGPAEDGGYYAIGMKHPHTALFNVTMSTPHVLRDTIAQAEQHHLRVRCLPTWYDVDTPADLQRLQAELYDHPERAPVTAAFLKQWEDAKT